MATSYQSDITKFLTKLKQENPKLEAGQLQGRSLLWDKDVDPEQQDEFRSARVAQKPYVYQTE